MLRNGLSWNSCSSLLRRYWFLGCLFPYPGILACIRLKLGAIDVQALQIHMFCFKDLLVDIVKYFFDGISEHFVDKVAECLLLCFFGYAFFTDP